MMRTAILMVVLAMLQVGCSTYSGSRYSMSIDNVQEIKTAVKTGEIKQVSVDGFTSTQPSKTSIMCRAVGPVKTPDGESFESYIRNALIGELKMSEAYKQDAIDILKGNLDNITFDSMLGTWTITMTVTLKGRSFTVTENYKFTPSWYGETGCNQTAQAMMPAMQNLIRKIVSHHQFKAWINGR